MTARQRGAVPRGRARPAAPLGTRSQRRPRARARGPRPGV